MCVCVFLCFARFSFPLCTALFWLTLNRPSRLSTVDLPSHTKFQRYAVFLYAISFSFHLHEANHSIQMTHGLFMLCQCASVRMCVCVWIFSERTNEWSHVEFCFLSHLFADFLVQLTKSLFMCIYLIWILNAFPSSGQFKLQILRFSRRAAYRNKRKNINRMNTLKT